MTHFEYIFWTDPLPHLIAVLTIRTDPLPQNEYNFIQTSKFFSFYLDIYKNKFKNLIHTSKFKFSFQGLCSKHIISTKDVHAYSILYKKTRGSGEPVSLT
jgi:hypothetical protein